MPSVTQPADLSQGLPPLPLKDGSPAAPQGRFQYGAPDSIKPSPFNPRGEASFDKADLAELAETLRTHGMLEPILVRPLKDGFELMGGERRWRAAKIAGLPEIPMVVREATDDEAMVLQIIENHQRKDLTPIEEAQSFVTLQKRDPKKWTAAAIGRAISRSDRFVAQRMALVTRLDPKARTMLEKGELSVEKARVLAVAPAQVQKTLIDDWSFDEMDAAALRESILEELVPEEAAAFDVALYKGGWHEEDKKRYFTDVEQFNKLQQGAVDAKVAELKARWPDAKSIEGNRTFDYRWADTGEYVYGHDKRTKAVAGKFKVDADKCIAIVWLGSDAKLKWAEGVCSSQALERASPSHSSSGSGPPRESADQKRIRLAFNGDLVKAIVANPALARRVMLASILFGSARVTYDNHQMKAMAKAILPEALHKLFEESRYGDDSDAAEWAEIKKLKDADVERIVSSFTALCCQWTYHPYHRNKEPEGLAAILAGELKIKLLPPEPKAKKAKPKAAAKKKAAAPKAKTAAKKAARKPAAKKAASRKKHQ